MVILVQEIPYQSFQTKTENKMAKAFGSSHTIPNTDLSGSLIIQKEGESSQANDVATQLALDEALARTMQETENHQFTGTSITENCWNTSRKLFAGEQLRSLLQGNSRALRQMIIGPNLFL